VKTMKRLMIALGLIGVMSLQSCIVRVYDGGYGHKYKHKHKHHHHGYYR
jgi:hypothetical protein